MTVIRLGPEYIPNPARSSALALAKIYIGEPDTDPTVVGNQKQVSIVGEDGNSVEVSQPLLTGAGGVIMYEGSAVVATVEPPYAMAVLNAQDSQIYYVASTYGSGVTSAVMTIFESSGVFTKADNVISVYVIAVGAGGGAGGVDGQGAGTGAATGGGAGGGSASQIFAESELSSTETVTIGAGGAGGISNSQGATGGTTTFGALLTATGGTGTAGNEGSAGLIVREGGEPGVGTVGDILLSGSPGNNSTIVDPSTSGVVSGFGGSSPISGGAEAVSVNTNGADAVGYGGGGGGAVNIETDTNYTGGDGADGVVIVFEYLNG